jgi:hypothetical protein
MATHGDYGTGTVLLATHIRNIIIDATRGTENNRTHRRNQRNAKRNRWSVVARHLKWGQVGQVVGMGAYFV